MISFFKHKKVEDTDLTSLAIPELPDTHSPRSIMYPSPPHHARHRSSSSRHDYRTTQGPPVGAPTLPLAAPGVSQVSQKIHSGIHSGIRGERQRNLALEQQIQMLSYQASLALDKLSEITRENDTLKMENEKLSSHLRHSVVTESNESFVTRSEESVFSKGMSQTSSMQSLKSIIPEGEGKEMRTIMEHNAQVIEELRSEITRLNGQLQKEVNDKNRIWRNFVQKRSSYEIELDLCKDQLGALTEQLQMRQQADLKLRERLMGYDQCQYTWKGSRTMN